MIREIITKRALKNSTTKIENNKEFPIVGEKLKTTSVDANPVEKEKIIETPKIPKKTEKVLPTKNENTQKKGPDSYREPIE
jgi:hypothetical protein